MLIHISILYFKSHYLLFDFNIQLQFFWNLLFACEWQVWFHNLSYFSCVHTLSQMFQTMFQSQRDPSFYSRLQCTSLCCQSLTSGVTPLREWERKLQTWINVTWIKCRLWTFLPDSVTSVFYLLICLTMKKRNPVMPCYFMMSLNYIFVFSFNVWQKNKWWQKLYCSKCDTFTISDPQVCFLLSWVFLGRFCLIEHVCVRVCNSCEPMYIHSFFVN